MQNDQIYALRNDLFTCVSCKPIGIAAFVLNWTHLREWLGMEVGGAS